MTPSSVPTASQPSETFDGALLLPPPPLLLPPPPLLHLHQSAKRLAFVVVQEQVLAKEADAARARRQKREAEASLEERLVLNAQQKEAARELKKQEVCRLPIKGFRVHRVWNMTPGVQARLAACICRNVLHCHSC